MPKEVEGCQTPVNATESQVLGEVVFEFIAALLWVLVSVGSQALPCGLDGRTVSRLWM